MKLQYKKTLRASALSGFVTLALSQPLLAATIYPISFDPIYTAINTTLSWRATTDLFVPTACAGDVGTQTLYGGFSVPPLANTFSGVSDCAGIQLQNTRLQFFLTDSPGTVYDTLTIGTYLADTNANSYGGLDVETQELFEMRFVGGVPVDFRTSMSTPVYAPGVDSLFFGNDVIANFSLALAGTPAGVALTHRGANEVVGSRGFYLGTEAGNVVRIRGLPEPGALGLVGAALAGLALSRRKRRPVSPAG